MRQRSSGTDAFVLVCSLGLIISLGPSVSAASQSLISQTFVNYDKLNGQSDTWQYSVPMGNDSEHRAYLWIPQNCKHVRGVLIGNQNMQEEPFFQDVTIRKACADSGLGIVWFSPGDDMGSTLYHHFETGAKDGVQKALTDLAAESGYSEIENAPLLATAHSASTPFVWGMSDAFASRMFALLPLKGWFTGHMTPNIPTLHISSEYAEVGGVNWGETYLSDRKEIARLRGDAPDRLIGEAVDIGAGHYEWNPQFAPVIAMFIRKAAQYRLPTDGPLTGSVTLKPIDPTSGALIDPEKLGTPDAKPVAYRDWQGDPTKAFWYLDKEMAQTVNNFIVTNMAKKPQVIDLLDDTGKPVDLSKGGVANASTKLMDDGVTIKASATYLDKSPTTRLYNGDSVGHSNAPILFQASSGAIKQTGPDTFRMWMRRGGLVQQGSPWGPTIMAYSKGDAQYRRADRPGHPWLSTVNKAGTAQTITFDKIPDQHVGAKSVTLHAMTDAGLPVQFYIISGPVELKEDNKTLSFLPIPPRSKFPIRVIIGSYQWGRITEPKVQNAAPIWQEFMIISSVHLVQFLQFKILLNNWRRDNVVVHDL